jgi:HEAT repeat protein
MKCIQMYTLCIILSLYCIDMSAQSSDDNEIQSSVIRFRTSEEGDRVTAARELRKLAESIPLLVETALEGLADGSPYVRRECVRTLGLVGYSVKDQKILFSLINSLSDEISQVRAAAAEALGSFGQEADSAVPHLVRLLNEDGDGRTRQMAAKALGAIAPDSTDAIHALITALKKGDYWVQKESAAALGLLGSPAAEALVNVLPTANTAMRENIGDALTMAGKEAVPLLVQLLASENPDIRELSSRCLGRLGGEALPALEPLKELLADEVHSVRETTAWAIGRIGGPPGRNPCEMP